MDELVQLLLSEARIERNFYAKDRDLWDVELRTLAALSTLLIKVQGRLLLNRENEEI